MSRPRGHSVKLSGRGGVIFVTTRTTFDHKDDDRYMIAEAVRLSDTRPKIAVGLLLNNHSRDVLYFRPNPKEEKMTGNGDHS